jgi:hypothetical protein
MKEVLIHGGSDEVYDRSVFFARRLAECFGTRLHILYTVEEPLSAGWTAEVSADRIPEVHQAIEEEARERLGQLIPDEEQEKLGIELVIATGQAGPEIVRYTKDHSIDLAIIQARSGDSATVDLARTVLEESECALVVLR